MAKRKYTAEEIVTVGCAQCIKLFLEDAMFGFAAAGCSKKCCTPNSIFVTSLQR